jgi:hypothetical protein
LTDDNHNKNLLTTFPPAPDFAVEKHEMYKFGGACIKSKLTRYFTVDQENLKYYEDKENRTVKKTLGLADALAFLEEKKDFDGKKNIP